MRTEKKTREEKKAEQHLAPTNTRAIMPLERHELADDAEFPALVDGLWRGYADPFNGFWEILKGPSQEECTERYTAWNKADSTGHWIYVTNSETKKVAGAMQWQIFKVNPYADGVPSLSAYWWPEGALKEVADQLFAGFFAGRPSHFGQPHIRKQLGPRAPKRI
ncbi:conserved hypothetical protein [Talaromyces stipitatus ATCC 10500]|uniref:N-acetyltransferase domain-containing protein n=1 Tax=Talaromyces stipitatus (strain ATCC 10500 / CBS 375.48 / QM 6759 / NRRL 1006) TaxID=441959 RepID=B8MPM8_TALSN|nr:uncharacterized protein TSTA_106770 [Talaromyces stipitatus ATCC 10500]EED14467.1 conserved hypothetical protein [Talaromyces stipitatus ATCC 10500]